VRVLEQDLVLARVLAPGQAVSGPVAIRDPMVMLTVRVMEPEMRAMVRQMEQVMAQARLPVSAKAGLGRAAV